MIKSTSVFSLIQFIVFVLILLFGYGLNNIRAVIYLTLIVYFLSFFIINRNKKNYFNISTFFLLGVGLLILGRLFAYLLDYEKGNSFCINFFLEYCLSQSRIISLITFVNITLIFFCLAYIVQINLNKQRNDSYLIHDNYLSEKNLKIFIIPLSYISLGLYSYGTIGNIKTALSSGYMALYAGQGESYTTPISVVAYSLIVATLALIFKNPNKVIKVNFRILITLFILINILTIISGSRSNFISSILVILWVFFYQKNIPKRYYLFTTFLAGSLLFSASYLANIAGARAYGESTSLKNSFGELFFSQGTSLIIMEAGTRLSDPPLLGYIKTLLPGSQILFTIFGINEIYKFDWSSYLAYTTDRNLYLEGFGLGWSVFADLYLIALQFLPFYLILIFLLGKLFNTLDAGRSELTKSLAFIIIFYVFSLSRASISPLIFTIIVFFILRFLSKIRLSH